MDEPRVLHVVIFKGRHYWVAQCLEISLATQADNLGELPERFARTLNAQIELANERGRDLLSTLPEAADRYWDMWPEVKQKRQARESPQLVESRWSWSLGVRGMRADVAFAN